MTTKEMIEVMQAFERGEQIEYRDNPNNYCNLEEWDDEWVDTGEPIWDWDGCEYRVKPQPAYRPYKNAAEFLATQKEHGMYLCHEDFPHWYRMPIWVTDKEIALLEIHKDNRIYEADMTLLKLFREFKWQDGTPCGVEEE